MANPLIGYTGAAQVSIPFCSAGNAGAEKGPIKATIAMAGVSFPGMKSSKK